MMITNKFVWFHFPKTAGTTTSEILNSNIPCKNILFQYKQSLPDKHIIITNFIEKYSEYKELPFIVGFRKLETWVSSFNRHHLRNQWKQKRRITNDIIEFIGSQTRKGLIIREPKKITELQEKYWMPADRIIEFWNLHDHLNQIQFVRQEYLLQDWGILLKKYFNIDISHNTFWENKNTNFSPTYCDNKNIEIMHKKNPLWSKLEEKIYD